jgi:hypothetical protein
VTDVLSQARSLEHAGREREAIEVLENENRRARNAGIERELIALRHRAFLRRPREEPAQPWPAVAPEPGPYELGPLRVERDELTAETLSTGIRRYGCVYVPGLLSDATATALTAGIDRAFDALQAHKTGATAAGDGDAWFEPFKPGPEYKLGIKRKWVVDNGGVWTVDSPPMFFALLEAYRAVGLVDTIAKYLGEPPALSVNKCTLKRIDGETGGEWHQDGAFLGDQIRTVNVWLSLSHCGDDAPGLDLVPQRIDRVLETGTEGATFDWAVGPGLVQKVATLGPVTRPVFAPGDALLFDELFLHRTAAEPSMSRLRYAIETWFFAPSAYPEGLVPVLI